MVKEKINILDVIPVIENDVKITIGKEGTYILSFPALRNRKLPKFISRFIKNKHLELDEKGTEVIKLIDGKLKIEEIIQTLSVYFECKNEYAARIIMFISGLKAQGAIKYIIKGKNTK